MAKTRRKTGNGSSQKRAMRPTWEGHLRLSLVTCPVALYTATERAADVHFNLINPKTNNRIRMQTVDAGTGQRRRSLRPGEGLRRLQEQVRAVREGRARRGEARIDAHHRHRGVRRRRRRSTASTGTSPITWRPAGKTGIEAYRRDPRRHGEAGQGGAGPPGDAPARAHLRAGAARRRHPAHHAAHATTRSARPTRCSTATCPSPIRACCEIAEKIIEQQEAEFDPTEFKDRYEDALRDLIERKKPRARMLVSSAEPEEEDKVVDLMDALRKSLKGGGGPSRDKADRFLEAHGRRPRAQSRKKARPRKRAA